MNYAIVAAGGKGKRFGNSLSKQLFPLKGKPILCWSIGTFEAEKRIDSIVLVYPSDESSDVHREVVEREHFKKVKLVPGGQSRFESVQNGFRSILGKEGDVVLIHDAARPLVSGDLVTRTLEAAVAHGAVVPMLPVQETVKEVLQDRVIQTVSRERLYMAQTPQGFRYEILKAAYESVEAFRQMPLLTDEAMLVEMSGFPVAVIPGERQNIKVTEMEDLNLAEFYLDKRSS